jgi:hypothetical protein
VEGGGAAYGQRSRHRKLKGRATETRVETKGGIVRPARRDMAAPIAHPPRQVVRVRLMAAKCTAVACGAPASAGGQRPSWM